jgi:hypothetical protein
MSEFESALKELQELTMKQRYEKESEDYLQKKGVSYTSITELFFFSTERAILKSSNVRCALGRLVTL